MKETFFAKITDKELDAAREKFLGKRVIITDLFEDLPKHRKNMIGGKLTFLGYNENFPSWNLCATVGNSPFQDIKIENIKLNEDYGRSRI